MTVDAFMDEILQADQARYAAMVAGDFDALALLLADELSYTHSSALNENKSQYLASLRSGRFRYQQARTEGVQVQVYGDQSAWMQGSVTLDVHIDGVPRQLNNRFLTVWTRRAGHWQLAAWASTPLPSP